MSENYEILHRCEHGAIVRLIPSCDPWQHKWVEVYYGYECSICGDFVPFGSEPWIDEEPTP
jgi:hypothetical protein